MPSRTITAIAAVLVLASCSSGGSSGSSARCEQVPAAKLDAIQTGVVKGSGVTLSDARAVKSDDFSKVWFIAARITGPNVNEVGVWASNALDGGGSIFAVDGFATQFTDWGDGGATDAKLSMSDDGAKEAQACAKGASGTSPTS